MTIGSVLPARQAETGCPQQTSKTRARRFERLAFRCEARLLEADWFMGEWTTLRIYAILRRERVGRSPA